MLEEIDAIAGAALPEIYKQNSNVLKGLLAGARTGWRPCVDAAGRIVLPPLPQQRRWPRKAVLQSCILHHKGAQIPAYVRDVSAGGLGLDRVPRLPRGDALRVVLECGRTFTGSVAWSSGVSAGLKFVAPLMPTDPLLFG